MAVRNMLHKKRVEEFLTWAEAQGKEVDRHPTGNYQIAGVKWGSGWQYLYSRERMDEHVSVPEPMYWFVRKFIDKTRRLVGSHQQSTNGVMPNGNETED